MMFKSKHSGWTWDLKRTPFGYYAIGDGYAWDGIVEPPPAFIPGGGPQRMPFDETAYGLGVPEGMNPVGDVAEYNAGVINVLNSKRNEFLRTNQTDAARNVSKDIEELTKQYDPALYYKAELDFLSYQLGRSTQMNEPTEGGRQKLSQMIEEAQKAGLSPTEIQNAVGTNIGIGQQAANNQLSTNWENVGGPINKYGYLAPFLLAGAGAATGLATGAAAAEGAGGALTAGEIAGSTGFTPVGGASFAIEPGAAYTAGAGAVGSNVSGLGTNAALQGPTYGELGVTGVPEGGMGPTYAEMGNTGLNTEQAISAADTAARNSQIAEALKTANQVRQGVNTANNLAKMLTSGAGSQISGAAQNLAQGQTGVGMAIPALIRSNQNPFLQTAQQPIRSPQPMDLSSLANALRQG
jgi:hypothetical protein